MQVELDRAVHVLSWIPAGAYELEIDEENEQFLLKANQDTYRLPVKKRSSKVRVTEPSVQIRPVVGEMRQLLIVRVPPGVEWVLSLEWT